MSDRRDDDAMNHGKMKGGYTSLYEYLESKFKHLEELVTTLNDPLASLQKADTDLATAVATETESLTQVLAALKLLAAQSSVSPAEVAQIASDLETSVANLNTANTTAQTQLNPPAVMPVPVSSPTPIAAAPAAMTPAAPTAPASDLNVLGASTQVQADPAPPVPPGFTKAPPTA